MTAILQRTLLVGLAVASLGGCATAYAPTEDAPFASGQDVRLAAYNVGFGAVVGAVGAAVNGERGTVWERAGRGALTGGAGGAGLYAGKWIAGQVDESSALAWGLPATLVHETAASVVENAALDDAPLGRLSFHTAFVRLDVRTQTGAVRARVMPLNAVAFGMMLAEGHRFSLGRSLVYGAPLFLGDERSADPLGLLGRTARGFVFLNTAFLWEQSPNFHETAGHELVHIMQHREFLRTGVLLHPLDDVLRQSETYRAVARYVYLDNVGPQAAVYFLIEGGADREGCYFDNWLEFEAEAFGERERVPC